MRSRSASLHTLTIFHVLQNDIYGMDVEVDFRGDEVTVENLIRVMTGRQHPDTPPSKRLLTDATSNILLYVTGHGGDEFLKFQDSEEIGAWDFADAVEQMRIQGRYNEILFMADTCQAFSLSKHFYSKNVIGVGSSLVGENSYSHHADAGLGVAIIDRFSYYTGEFMEKYSRGSDTKLSELFNYYQEMKNHLFSTVGVRVDLMGRPMSDVKLMDFFGSVQQTEVLGSVRNVTSNDEGSPQHSSAALKSGLQREHFNFASKGKLGTGSIAQKLTLKLELISGICIFACILCAFMKSR